ncbi:MAG: Hsp20/alpha crystallin family protein [Acidobacteriaceae bacterium]
MAQLVKFTPFSDIDKFFNDDFFMPILPRTGSPAIDLYETDNEIVAEVSVPGIDPKKVNIEIENNILHIRSEESEEKLEQGRDYYRKEVRKGVFARSIGLPVEVEADKVSASSEKGMLKIVMPKSEKAKPKKVHVDVK